MDQGWTGMEGLRYFSPDEFPDDVLPHVDPRLMHALDEYRHILGSPVIPSPLSGGWARFEAAAKGSRHYAVGRKSDAGDVFPLADHRTAWRTAVSCGLWGGIGIYFDTELRPKKPWAMLHLDLRPRSSQGPLWWARIGGRYLYPDAHGAALEKAFFRAMTAWENGRGFEDERKKADAHEH